MESGRIVLTISLLTAMLLAHPARSGAATVMELYGTFHAMGVIVTLTAGEDPDQDAAATLSCRVAGSGGWNAAYSASTGVQTTLAGVLAIGSGSLTIDALAIK